MHLTKLLYIKIKHMRTENYSENTHDFLRMFKCISANTFITSNSWENAARNLKTADQFSISLFISHRWETLEHPDPEGHQFKAIQNMIDHITTAVKAFHAISNADHLKFIPDLGRHGVLQGMMIATRLLNKIMESTQEENQILALISEPEKLIGVWYDAACLPQEMLSRDEVQRTLIKLPEFVQHPNVCLVALREPKDDYEQRGWCMMEFMLATKQSIYSPLVYRPDLEKQKITINLNFELALQFEKSIRIWSNSTPEIALKLWKFIFLLLESTPELIEQEHETPTLSIKSTLQSIFTLQFARFTTEKNCNPQITPLDIIRTLHLKTNLLTTLEEDGIIVYLLILFGGLASRSPLEQEFREYLNQAINAKNANHRCQTRMALS